MEVDPSYEDYCREQNNNNLLVVKIGELADACSPVDLMFFCHNNNVQPVCVDALGNGFGIFAFSNANYLNHFLEILRRTEFIQLGNGTQTRFRIVSREHILVTNNKRRSNMHEDAGLKFFKADN